MTSLTRVKATIAGVIGTALEYYDTMLYMHFLPILTPLFFPSEDPQVSSLLGMASFAIGFCIRPLGGVIFGHIGDRLGRKTALGASVLLISLPTFLIGVLPTYAQMGITASLILLLCRLLQNLCVAGEAIGGSIFLVEHATPGYESRSSSLLNIACQLGSLLGAGLGLICLYVFLPNWGWRIPFLCGALFGIGGYYFRKKIAETPVFLKMSHEKTLATLPVGEALKKDKTSLLRTVCTCASIMSPFQIIYVYMGDLLRTRFHLLPDQILIHNMKIMVLMITTLALMGYIADKVGYKRVMKVSLLGAITASYPSFYLVEQATTPQNVLMVQGLLAILACGVAAPCCVFLSNLFPARERYSGYALGWSLGSILFAGLTPLLSLLLVQGTGDQKAPAYILVLCATLGLLAMADFHKVKSFFLLKVRESNP